MHLKRPSVVWLTALALVMTVVACAGGSGAGASPSPMAGQPTSGSAAGSGGQVVNVTLVDALRIEPAQIAVRAGQVDFVVTNTGTAEHEFFIGDEAAQAQHEKEMSQGGMAMDEPDGISVAPGATKTLSMFLSSAGILVGGCHVSGHYAAGMKTQITISG